MRSSGLGVLVGALLGSFAIGNCRSYEALPLPSAENAGAGGMSGPSVSGGENTGGEAAPDNFAGMSHGGDTVRGSDGGAAGSGDSGAGGSGDSGAGGSGDGGAGGSGEVAVGGAVESVAGSGGMRPSVGYTLSKVFQTTVRSGLTTVVPFRHSGAEHFLLYGIGDNISQIGAIPVDLPASGNDPLSLSDSAAVPWLSTFEPYQVGNEYFYLVYSASHGLMNFIRSGQFYSHLNQLESVESYGGFTHVVSFKSPGGSAILFYDSSSGARLLAELAQDGGNFTKMSASTGDAGVTNVIAVEAPSATRLLFFDTAAKTVRLATASPQSVELEPKARPFAQRFALATPFSGDYPFFLTYEATGPSQIYELDVDKSAIAQSWSGNLPSGATQIGSYTLLERQYLTLYYGDTGVIRVYEVGRTASALGQ